MKPERIQIFAMLVDGAKSFAAKLVKVLKWIDAVLERLIFGCRGDDD